MYKSVADEIKEVLSVSRKPKTMKEIGKALDRKYPTSYLNKHLRYWENKGEIIGKTKKGYQKIKEYELAD